MIADTKCQMFIPLCVRATHAHQVKNVEFKRVVGNLVGNVAPTPKTT